jgi:ABC-type transport system substrate-binding protein
MLSAEIVARSLLESIELLPGVRREPLQACPLVDSIVVVDDRVVEFRLTTPLPEALLASLALPANVIAHPDESFNGTGAFRFEGHQLGLRVVLERFEHHWGGQPRLERLVYVVIADEVTRVVALKAGEVDAMTGVTPEMFDELAADGGYWLDGVPCCYRAVARRSVGEFSFHPDHVLRLWEAGWGATDTLVVAVPEMQ